MVAGTWVVVASFLAAAGTLALMAYLWGYREKPGADWFLVSLGGQFVWSLAYGVALLVFDPTLRFALEVVVWAAMATLIAGFLAFVLEYTGRATVRGRRALLVAAAPVAMIVVTATNPWHTLAWTGFAVDPVAGLATAAYDLRLWAVLGTTAGVLLASVASLLLFDTVLSYGPLYRREAVAVGLSTIPPSVALLVWVYGVGPTPELNLATVFFLPHIALDAYAFVGNDMFEFHPATRRAGERAAIEDLGSPVLVVDERNRVVTLNDAAAEALAVDRRAVLTAPLDTLLDGASIDPAAEDQRITLRREGTVRTYAVTTTPLSAGREGLVGHTVVLQDVTEDRRREQRLAVLNRVLRHNLRNDMTVVRGFAEAAQEQADEEPAAMLDRVVGKADDLVALGETARDIERVLDGDVRRQTVPLDTLFGDVVGAVDADEVTVDTALTPADCAVSADPEMLAVVLETLLENAVVHGASPGETVTLSATAEDGRVAITVADDGPGLPANELAVLDAGEETPLEHGTGLGLWLVTWGVERLGGELTVDAADGTTVTVTLPAA